MSKMRAARFYGKGDMRVEQVDEPTCGDDQVKVKPAFTGICGTDLHEYLGGPNFAPSTPHPITKETIPITFGHEFSGTILEVGKNVKEPFQPGQKVSIQPTLYDGTCSACKLGVFNACSNGGFIGLSGWGGGLSDAVTLSPTHLVPLPSHIPLDIAALVEPLSVGWHAVSQSPLRKDSTILIIGGGPIGIAVLLALRARGCGQITVSEPSASRQSFARHFGADTVLDPSKLDILAEVKTMTGDEGVDIVFDCAGVASGLECACQAIKARGTVVNVAIWEKAVPFNPNWLVFRQGRFIACLGYLRKDFEEVIEAIASGAMKPGDMITSKVKLENVVEEGIKDLIARKERHVKILVEI